jgi:hypothetical protein
LGGPGGGGGGGAAPHDLTDGCQRRVHSLGREVRVHSLGRPVRGDSVRLIMTRSWFTWGETPVRSRDTESSIG